MTDVEVSQRPARGLRAASARGCLWAAQVTYAADREYVGTGIEDEVDRAYRGVPQVGDLAAGLAARGVPVISGLAAGIDTAAHTTALAAGGRAVAVIGTGIDRAYPAQNAALQEEIATKGLLISQFLPGAPPTKTSFPMRNAVMSGYALATVVIEAAYQSGARMQARLALQHGRHVFLMRSLLQHDWARGYAERPGVTIVDNAEHVFDGPQRLAAQSAESTELVWA